MIEFKRHLKFEPGPDRPKTKTWKVLNKYDNILLGWVCWFCQWRKYAFYPSNDTVFEQDCLRDISDFIESKTRAHKARARANSSQHG